MDSELDILSTTPPNMLSGRRACKSGSDELRYRRRSQTDTLNMSSESIHCLSLEDLEALRRPMPPEMGLCHTIW